MTNKFFVCSECAIPVDNISEVDFRPQEGDDWFAEITYKECDSEDNTGFFLYDQDNAKKLAVFLQNL